MPNVTTTVITGAGHALTVSHVDECARVLNAAT